MEDSRCLTECRDSVHGVNGVSVRQKLLWLDDDGPTREGLCSGEARKQEGRKRIHCVREYFTEFCFLSSYFIYPNSSPGDGFRYLESLIVV